MLFSEIYIPEKIKKELIHSARKGRIAHAQLFVGREGWGGLSLALAYSQYLNCENPSEYDSCDLCKSCKKYKSLFHPDLYFVYPVVKTPKNSKPYSSDFIDQWKKFINSTKFHSLDQWLKFIGYEKAQPSIYVHEAQKLIQNISFKPLEGKYKIIIFWLPEKMNIATANKLLKIIEEPPDYTIFLFITTDLEAILPTIRSRTQIIQLYPLSSDNLTQSLEQEFPNAKLQEIEQIAFAANGDFIIAKKLLQEQLNLEQGKSYFDKFVNMMRITYSANVLKIIENAEEIASMDKEQLKQFLTYSIHLIRQSFLVNQNLKQISQLTQKEFNFVQKFSLVVNKKNISHLYKNFSEAINNIERNGNSRLIILDLLFTLTKIIKMK